MSLLVETLNRIVDFLESSHPIMIGIARSLQPGLSYEEITSKLEDFPYLLPTELVELYQWRNGQAGAYSDGFAPYHQLLSLEDALKEYKIQIEVAMEFSEEDLPWQKLYDPCWLPIFKEDSNFYVIPTSLKPQKHSPILCKSDYASGDDVWKSEVFPNLTNMMLAVAECWESGAYHTAKNIYGEDYLSFVSSKESMINLKYQLGQKRSVELLLNAQESELSEEELIRAYYDLVAINHPRAEEILKRDSRNYARRNSNLSKRLEYLLNELKREQESG